MKTFSFLLSCLLTFTFASTSLAKTHYAKSVKSMTQDIIPSPVRKDEKKVFEGSGPIAGAMLLGYWQTERGKKNLLERGFDGTKHPSKAIVKLYKEMKSKKSPVKKVFMSLTMPDNLFRALKKRVKNVKGLDAARKRKTSRWSAREKALKAQLRKGNPVILLKNREHKDGCLGRWSKGLDPIKNIVSSRYFLAVGYKGNEVAIIPGRSEKPKSASSGFGVHKKDSASHDLCTFDELKKANVSLFWLE